MSDDVFASDQTSDSVLDTLVGEGKKFDNVEALAKGKAESDAHIARVEQENATLKEENEAFAAAKAKEGNVSEVLQAIKDASTTQEGSDGGQTMSKDELENLVRTVVTDGQEAQTKASNRAIGNKLVLDLVEGNVEAARQLVTERAAALGMSPTALAALSEQSPDAFAELVHPDKSTASSGSTQILPNVNRDALGTSAPLEVDGFKTKAYFDAQKKEMGHVKWLNNSAQQREFARSMNGLGERFNN